MGNKKKILFNGIFLAAVFGLTMYGVFHGADLGQLAEDIQKANPLYLLAAVACVVFFIWGESIIIYYMMGSLGTKLKKRKCFLFSSVGFFFSCITPSATGGQPAQIYYMRKEKIPIPVSTIVLMIITITYKAVLVLVGLFLAFFQRGFLDKYLTSVLPVFYLGLGLNVFCVAFMLILVFHPVLAKAMMMKGLTLLERLHLMKKKRERMERLEASMDKYNETAAYLRSHMRIVFEVLGITFLQRFALFFVTYFVYRSFGLAGTSVYDVVMLQAVISISVDMLPLPGGMGISETLFMQIFVPVFGGMLLPGMILSRSLSYYTELLLSALMTVAAHFTLGRERKKREERLS